MILLNQKQQKVDFTIRTPKPLLAELLHIIVDVCSFLASFRFILAYNFLHLNLIQVHTIYIRNIYLPSVLCIYSKARGSIFNYFAMVLQFAK